MMYNYKIQTESLALCQFRMHNFRQKTPH